MRAPEDLKRIYKSGRLIPFVGAGASMSITWEVEGVKKRGPSWRELVDKAATLLGFSDPALLRVRGQDLQILEYFAKKNAGTQKLTNWFYREMNPPEDALRDSAIHAGLARLSRCRIVYTTNYDDFVERALRSHGHRVHTVAIEAHMGRAAQDMIEVVKFHGDWNHPEKMVLTESNYERRLRLDDPLDLRFRSDLLGRTALFIGYSFRDANVAYIFRLMNDSLHFLPDSNTGRRAYVFVEDPSDFEHELFHARNIEVIPIRGSHRTEDIAATLRELEAS